MPKKGSSFEREISKKFSLWWSGGEDDFIFWRTSQSGGRATVRGRVGKRTHGHCGDLCAVHPSGEPLTQLLTIELKRGYNRATPSEILDKPARAKDQKFEEFLDQSVAAAERAGTPYWMLIHKRDMRPHLVYFEFEFYDRLQMVGCDLKPPILTLETADEKGQRVFYIVGTLLENFLDAVDPEDIRAILRKEDERKRRRAV